MSSSQRVASSPASSASSRRAVASGSSPSWSRVPGHDLEHQGVDGRPVLPYQRHGAVVVDGDDRDGARVPDDDAVEGLAVRVEEVQTVHPEQPGPQEFLLRDAAEARHGPR